MTANTFDPQKLNYQHTQPGKLMLVILLGATAVIIGLGAASLRHLWLAAPVLLGCAWLFHSLTIVISERELVWHFGPGLIRKRAPLAEIVAARPIRTTWLNGWGIHLTRHGWLYNVSGFDAVAITLRNGKRFALGTDEPQRLAAQLEEVIRHQSGADRPAAGPGQMPPP